MSRYHIAVRLVEEMSALETLKELEEDNQSEKPPVSSVMLDEAPASDVLRDDMASNSPQPAPG